MSDEERKLFIDEGWKAQVQREKEEAARKQAEAPADASDADDTPLPVDDDAEELPEASFSAFLAGMVPQALYALGLIPQEGQQQVFVDLGQAKYIIDMLMMLEEKTQGNLTEQESGELTQAISELTRVFAMRAQQIEEMQLKQAGIDPNHLKGGPQ
jgi:hypothetical protein